MRADGFYEGEIVQVDFEEDSYNEGQPMAVLEAMGRGICVISTTAGGIPDMLGDDGGIAWPGPAGRTIQVEILEVVYQPERAGELHR